MTRKMLLGIKQRAEQVAPFTLEPVKPAEVKPQKNGTVTAPVQV